MRQSSATAELQQLLATPPANFVGNAHNSHAVAHASLEALRDSGDPSYLFLWSILEIFSQQFDHQLAQQELLFHCITGARQVILFKWNRLSAKFKSGVRDFFLVAGQKQANVRVIQLACYSSSCSFWKRGWVEISASTPNSIHSDLSSSSSNDVTTSPEEESLLEFMKQLLHPPTLKTPQDLFQYLEPQLQNLDTLQSAAQYLSTLIGEFSGTSSSNYRMPLEFHKKAHLTFELEWLTPTFFRTMKALSSLVHGNISQTVSHAVVQLTIDVLGWPFGSTAWEVGVSEQKTLLHLPATWGQSLLQSDLVRTIVQNHHFSRQLSDSDSNRAAARALCHGWRQLLIQLASLTGPIYSSNDDRYTFCTHLVDATLELYQSIHANNLSSVESSQLLDTLSLTGRIVGNFKLSVLVKVPHFSNLLEWMAAVGRQLLQDNLRECEEARGDFEVMENREWREEAIVLLLEGIVLLCGDPWLLYSGAEQNRLQAQAELGKTLAPLYSDFVMVRVRMARLEEQYLASHETELDELREEIFAVDLEEEMQSLANLGRLDLHFSLSCLSKLFQGLSPELKSLWDGPETEVSPEAAGMLEESRLVTLYIGHLLTDDNTGETPVIPDEIVIACQNSPVVSEHVCSAVQTLFQFAELQASKLAINPLDLRLSPLLAKAFLWFLKRWAPAYILPVDYGAAKSASPIMVVWASPGAVKHTVQFCITLCLHYHSYWPHERQVQENCAELTFLMAKRCSQLRLALVASPPFRQLLEFHRLTAGIRHSAPPLEFESTVLSKCADRGSNLDINQVRGYQRLPYDVKSRIVSALLVGCSESNDQMSAALFEQCLRVIHDSFSSLVQALSTNQVDPDNIDAKEMACLCVELYAGVARAGDMDSPTRIPKILTPYLPHLSGLMAFYAKDLAICESLLRLFRDYAEQFIAILDPVSCNALFEASGELLKNYSAHHCTSRVITHSTEEEQNYNDILCAIQLLIQLGTRDFLDPGSNSTQVTDIIFFGLQQILPLMTQGLLEYQNLCTNYFSLVGFMMETYPEKVAVLPFELFDALLESLTLGMSHHDCTIGKTSLQGLGSILREHMRHRILDVHLQTQKGDGILEKCSRRFLMDVVFQSIVWDRLESSAMFFLPLAAADLSRFGSVVRQLTLQLPTEHQSRVAGLFQNLLNPEVVGKVGSQGYEGRQNRIKFKKDFEVFCHEIHSFLVLK